MSNELQRHLEGLHRDYRIASNRVAEVEKERAEIMADFDTKIARLKERMRERQAVIDAFLKESVHA